MLGFVQNIFSSKCNPIGVDFGSDCLRLAQVNGHGPDYRLVAAANADVPTTARHDPGARLNYFVEAIRDPTHPEHDDMLNWVGGRFDPEACDVEAINRELAER